YMTDHEPFWSVPGRLSQHPGDERHIAFMRGADLVIHDAQYTEEEYRDKVGWGHSPLEYAVDVALAAGARRLVLFHHDPQHDDAVAAIEEVLGEDALVLLRLADVPAALSRGSELRPDLAIIDRELLASESELATLRARLGRGNLPVVVLADGSGAADVVGRGEASSTDYLARPFSPPMLRARVRAWLSRTLAAADASRGPRP